MDRLRKSIQWLNKLSPSNKKPSYDHLSTYDDALALDFGILSRLPMADSRIESPEPLTFSATLTEGTAEPKATADILRRTLDGKIKQDDHPMYWDRRFFHDNIIDYFAAVFSHVCLFRPEEREAVMAECTPLFERLEESIKSAADSIARGEMTVDNLTPRRRSNAAQARGYLDKLTDLHMTRLGVVRGRYDEHMRLWREAQGRLFELEFGRESRQILKMLGRGQEGCINFSYPRYGTYSPEDSSSEYPGQWLRSLGYPAAPYYLSYFP
ncbi:unnamed protein product [Clonostachys rosea f. rosea IK726]|uniref:Uncharacterized protein n=1 Tax=Clonostachys rosea f. rosea IK726 TaxID=1349383 RepID=A0ACA9TG42_BIOOC|nr:unnamed protein product [Clonostachys rosea f. rosea IK726]